MKARTTRPKNVDEYIEAAAPAAQKKLRQLRACIQKVVPDATEGLKWSMPAYSTTRILVIFAAHQRHIGFYPTPSAIRAFAKDLKRFKTSRGAIQFPLDEPLPLPLVRKITRFRMRECAERDRKWMSH